MAVYLIHFAQKFHHTQHYIGFSETMESLETRLLSHQKGTGAKILRALNEKGIGYDIVRVWFDGDRAFERKLKNRKEAKKFCPCCTKPVLNPK